MYTLEVGSLYSRNDSGFDPIIVTKRTEKTIWVTQRTWDGKEKGSWTMRVRTDDDGNEWAVDYQIPVEHRLTMAFQAKHKETA